MKRAIIFPGGAGGNHLRWLMYLDSSIDGHLPIDNKLLFITDDVYSNERSFFNWLSYESIWRYQDHYESFIKILHEPKDDLPNAESVFMVYDDWNPVIDHYSILRSFFLSEQFYNGYIDFLNSFEEKIKNNDINTDSPNKLVIKSDIFFEKELDYTFYKSVIDLFNFEDHYKEACIIHEKWYETRQRVKQEAYEFYNSKFWKEHVNRLAPAERNIQRDKRLFP